MRLRELIDELAELEYRYGPDVTVILSDLCPVTDVQVIDDIAGLTLYPNGETKILIS
jgi:hypothetical protein